MKIFVVVDKSDVGPRHQKHELQCKTAINSSFELSNSQNDHDAAIFAFITKSDNSCNFIVSVGSTYTERLVQHFKVNDEYK